MSYINMSFNDVAKTIQIFDKDSVKLDNAMGILNKMNVAASRVTKGEDGYTFFKKEKKLGMLELKNAAVKVVAGYEKKMGIFARIVEFVERKIFGQRTDLAILRELRDDIKTKIGDLVVVTDKNQNPVVVSSKERDDMVKDSLYDSLENSVAKAKEFEGKLTEENKEEVNVIHQSCEDQLAHIKKIFNASSDVKFILVRNEFANIKNATLVTVN